MLPKEIPDKLPGTVQRQYVRCGKPNCKCARGELHGPLYYRYWRDEDGRQHREYVRKADLEATRAACAAWRAQQRAVRALLAKGPAVVRWHEGDKAPGKDPLAWIERCAEMLAATEMLTRLAYGAFGRPSEQVEAARLVAQIRAACRPAAPNAPARQDGSAERVAALMRGTSGPRDDLRPPWDRRPLPAPDGSR